jgi:hypothetical protein
VVLITHKLRDAMSIADDVTVLRHGRVALTCRRADVDEDALATAMLGKSREYQSRHARDVTSVGKAVVAELRGVSVRDARGPWRSTGLIGTLEVDRTYMLPKLVEGGPLLAWFGAENVSGFEAILPSAYVRYARAAGAEVQPAGRFVLWTRFDSPLLDAAGLRFLFLPPSLDPGPGFTLRSKSERLAVYERWQSRALGAAHAARAPGCAGLSGYVLARTGAQEPRRRRHRRRCSSSTLRQELTGVPFAR